MSITKPFYRIARVQRDSRDLYYVLDHRYAPDRYSLCHAYWIIQNDSSRLFEYIAPCDKNRTTHSHRTYELLLRACTEFETNCKAILAANGYSKTANLTIKDYSAIDQAMCLSRYKVLLRTWSPLPLVIEPFANWANGHSLTWYQAYNASKHDRNVHFRKANLENTIRAIAGLLCVLFGQFSIQTASLYRECMSYQTDADPMYGKLMGLDGLIFDVAPYMAWKESESYELNWDQLSKTPDPFQQFAFT